MKTNTIIKNFFTENFYNILYPYSKIVNNSKTYFEIFNRSNEYVIKNHANTDSYLMLFAPNKENTQILNIHFNYMIFKNEVENIDFDIIFDNHKKGVSYFNKNFKKISPKKKHIKTLIQNFNIEWKTYLFSIHLVITENVLCEIGFNNGLITAYIEYENNYKYLFENIISPKETTKTKTEPENQNENNLFETYFINETAFNNFQKYINEKYILDEFTDFSYLFQRMKNENLIIPKTHLEFAEWLNNKEYITDKGLDQIINNKGFKTRAFSVNRENNYNRIFAKIN